MKKNPCPESASELYRLSDSRLSAKLVPTFADRECHVVRVTGPYFRILGLLDRSRYFFFQVAPQLYSRGRVDPVPDPLLLRKSGIAGNWTRDLWIFSQELWLDHRGGHLVYEDVNFRNTEIILQSMTSWIQVSTICRFASTFGIGGV
jgi:hypothetical protein